MGGFEVDGGFGAKGVIELYRSTLDDVPVAAFPQRGGFTSGGGSEVNLASLERVSAPEHHGLADGPTNAKRSVEIHFREVVGDGYRARRLNRHVEIDVAGRTQHEHRWGLFVRLRCELLKHLFAEIDVFAIDRVEDVYLPGKQQVWRTPCQHEFRGDARLKAFRILHCRIRQLNVNVDILKACRRDSRSTFDLKSAAIQVARCLRDLDLTSGQIQPGIDLGKHERWLVDLNLDIVKVHEPRHVGLAGVPPHGDARLDSSEGAGSRNKPLQDAKVCVRLGVHMNLCTGKVHRATDGGLRLRAFKCEIADRRNLILDLNLSLLRLVHLYPTRVQFELRQRRVSFDGIEPRSMNLEKPLNSDETEERPIGKEALRANIRCFKCELAGAVQCALAADNNPRLGILATHLENREAVPRKVHSGFHRRSFGHSRCL